VAGNLKSRLARLKAAEKGRPAPEEAAAHRGAGRPDSGELPGFLAGWEPLAPFVYTRELMVADPLPELVDPAPFLPLASRRGATWARGEAGLEETIESGRLRFFDLETTGLSGGSGTIAFLAALGRRSPEGLAIRQFFLADYPGEREFVSSILDSLSGPSVLATYNGKSFDYPLLRTRCVMNGLAAPEPPHLDVLYPARRLWRKASGGASLGLLESLVLGQDRGPDVPGSRIPALYLDFLRTGEEAEMGLVMSHNASDVSSLARLLSRVSGVYESPLRCGDDRLLDRASLGRSLLALDRAEEAEALLEEDAASGDEEAFVLLSRRYRGQGRGRDFERIWERRPSGYASAVEGAKYFEHGKRDWNAALEAVVLAEGEAGLPREAREALAWRRARLERKLGKGPA
jgi:uncharacterized protein YprB with RNaseH-like and TPR domain